MISPEALKFLGYTLSTASVLLLAWIAMPDALTTLTGTWALITGVCLSILGMTLRYLAFLRSNGNGSK